MLKCEWIQSICTCISLFIQQIQTEIIIIFEIVRAIVYVVWFVSVVFMVCTIVRMICDCIVSNVNVLCIVIVPANYVHVEPLCVGFRWKQMLNDKQNNLP